MGRLNQVIAVVAGKKANATKIITDVYHVAQKADLFNGIARHYRPKDDDGERLPSETKAIQNRATELIKTAVAGLVEMIDTIATQDTANCQAKADIVLESEVLVTGVPVTHLLFLEKQMTDLTTLISKLPVLDLGEDWHYDKTTDCYATDTSETTRTKKVPKTFVKYEATEKHPAQVDVFTEDIIVGYWQTVKLSGALPAKVRNDMLERVRLLKEAIVKAREEANNMEVTQCQIGKRLLGYVFGTSAVSS